MGAPDAKGVHVKLIRMEVSSSHLLSFQAISSGMEDVS